MKIPAFLRLLLSLLLALGLMAGSAPAHAGADAPAKSTFTVNEAGDQSDASTSDSACDVDMHTFGSQCTLRAAIEQANAQSTGEPHTITFSGDLKITPASNLPGINRNGTIIDGGGHKIDLSPATTTVSSGLYLSADNCAVRGLIIDGFPSNIIVFGNYNTIGTDGNGINDSREGNVLFNAGQHGIWVMGNNNIIAGNQIGTSASETHPNQTGVVVTGQNTRIGTDGSGLSDAAERNVISGNIGSGIFVSVAGEGGIIAGNIIGLNPTGASAIPNGGDGITVNNASNLRIGTDGNGSAGDAAEGNTIAGNDDHGISINAGNGHIIAGNRIGVGKTGEAISPGSQDSGIYLTASAGDNIRIGTNGDGQSDILERNILSSSEYFGVNAYNNNLTIAGNYIGTNGSGTTAAPNTWGGVFTMNGTGIVIGMNGDNSPGEANEGNLVSGNGFTGIQINNNIQPRVSGNRVGVNAAGTQALPNTYNGILVDDTSSALIGSDNDGLNDSIEGNLISGNGGHGLFLISGTQDALVYGNIIGLGSDKESAIPNTYSGISVDGASGTRIGGLSAAQSNLIGNNTENGIGLYTTTSDTQITNNLIGVTPSGAPAGNSPHGIYIFVSTTKSGEAALIDSNLIQYNNGAGIYLTAYSGVGYKFSSNRFQHNGSLAIDIQPDGVFPNDTLDADGYANGQQNFPEISKVAFPAANQIQVTGALHSTPSATFTVEIYAALEADPSGYGEGLLPVGQISVNTDASGNAAFTYTGSWSHGNIYRFYSALATAADGSTSEFGPNLEMKLFFLPLVSR